MDKRLLFFVLAIFAGYQFFNKSPDKIINIVSASSINEECDAVIFTTASCPYCQKARVFLEKQEIAWCEYDINESTHNYTLYKEHGGGGVPLAIIGSTKLRGYNKQKYLSAIKTI